MSLCLSVAVYLSVYLSVCVYNDADADDDDDNNADDDDFVRSRFVKRKGRQINASDEDDD